MIKNNTMRIVAGIVLIMTMLITPVYSKENTGLESDKSFVLLEGLGVYNPDDTSVILDSDLSRGDAAGYLASFLGLDTSGYVSDEIPFTDVSEENKNYKAICVLLSNKIVSSGEIFRPDDPISANEALKMVITALGYEPLASAKGGYPNGYVSVASSLKINKYLTHEVVTVGEMFELLTECADVDIMEFGGEYMEVKKDVGILDEYRGIIKTTGVVTANSDTDIETMDGGSTVREHSVKINGMSFKDSEDKARDFIGREIEVYYDKNTDEIISAEASDDAKMLKISAKDFENAADDSTIVYYDNVKEKIKTAKLDSKSVHVLINGQYFPFYGKDDISIKNGYMDLYDTDSDGSYELVKVWEPKVFVVDSSSDSRIYFKYNELYKSNEYIESNDDTEFYIDGERAETSDFEQWDIINIYELKTGSRVRVESEYKRVSGILNSLKDDIIIIDGTEYDVNPNSHFNADDYELGSEIDAYLDLSDRVYAASRSSVQNSSDELKTAYICSIGSNDVSIGKSVTGIKLFNSDGKFKWYTVAKKLKIYGKEDKTGKKFDTDKNNDTQAIKNFLSLCGDGSGEYQLIKYKVNSNEEITAIYCAIPKENIGDTDGKYPLELSYNKDPDAPRTERNVYNGVLAFAYSLNWGFDFWQVPNNKDDEELYSIRLAQNVGLGDGALSDIKLYNVNSNGLPEYALRVTYAVTGETIGDDDPTGVITESGITDANGEDMRYIKVISKGGTQTLYMTDDFVNKFAGEKYFYEGITADDLAVGDVVHFMKNEKNHINALRVLVRNSDRGDYRIKVIKASGSYSVGDIMDIPETVIHMVYGEVTETDGGACVKIKTGVSKETTYLFRYSGQVIKRYTIIDTKGRKVTARVGTAADISVGDKVAFRWTWKGIDDVFVYKD